MVLVGYLFLPLRHFVGILIDWKRKIVSNDLKGRLETWRGARLMVTGIVEKKIGVQRAVMM